MWDGQPLPLPASHLFARAYVRGVRGGPFCPVLKKEKNPGYRLAVVIFSALDSLLDRN